MKNKALSMIILAVAIATIACGYVLRHPLEFGRCDDMYIVDGQRMCSDDVGARAGEPAEVFGYALLAIAALSFFFPRHAVLAWLRFAAPWTALSILLVSCFPVVDGSIVPLERGVISLFANILFVLVSAALLVLRSRKSGLSS